VYRLQLSSRAEKDLNRLQGATWERVRDALVALRDDPRPHGSKKMRGAEDSYRIRIGDYRAVYDVDDSKQIVIVQRVRHRREVYRDF
jgi:mRNA interferase RelE/StbE